MYKLLNKCVQLGTVNVEIKKQNKTNKYGFLPTEKVCAVVFLYF